MQLKHLIFSFLFSFFALTNLIAQKGAMVAGLLLDGTTNEPLEYATISLLNPSDESLVTGGVSAAGGTFAIQVDPGDYIARIQFVTYETINLPVVVSQGKATNLGTVKMQSASEELDEVVVQAEKTQMELNLDKKVYNVGKDLSNLGGSATDILANLPSITTDVEGNVELRGSSNVKILIDGKPSGLVGLSSTDALRQLQGSMIESIEIITNPSARYDAEGMAGIINIILKKDQRKGVNGSFQVNTGYPHNHGGSVNMNFRREWVNFFINYGANYRNAPGTGRANQQYMLDEPSETTGLTDYLTKMKQHRMRGGLDNNIRVGMDFFVSESSQLTAAFLYRYSDELNVSTLKYFDMDLAKNPIAYTRREDDETEGDENLEYSLNYTKNFKGKEHKLTADIQYQNNYELEKSDIVQFEGNTSDTAIPALYQKVKNDEGEDRLMLQADYIHPFSKEGKFEIGFRSTIRNVKNIYDVDQRESEEQPFVKLDEFSTDFSYNERVHAAYGIASNTYDRFSWQAGLRVEMTDIGSEQKEDTVKRSWNYTNYFPSFFLTYKLTDQAQLQLSYSRRINRPRFRELNPFSSFTDNRNFRVGNPQLQPEFTDSYEFGLLRNAETFTVYYGIYYRYTDDLINRVSLPPNENGERYRVPYNIGERHDLGMEANIAREFTSWYRISGNFNFFRTQTIGSVGDSLDLGATAITFSTRLSNNFKFPDLFDAQLNINYRAPQQDSQGKRYSMSSVDLGLSRDIWNNNGTLAFSLTDIFNTRKYRGETKTEGFYERSYWQWRRGPIAQVTLTYRLNQKKARPARREGGDDFGGDF